MNRESCAVGPQYSGRNHGLTALGVRGHPFANSARTQQRHGGGFTLIEVMIVIAILGVLAAISIPAYQDYIENTNMAKVTSHFESAARFAEVELRKVQTDISIGRVADVAAADATGNYTQAGFVAMLNGNGGTAPGGGAPYAEGGGNTTTGAIGITISGTLADGDWEATIERPKIYGFAQAASRKSSWGNL